MRTAVVTGGAGFIGSWLVNRLACEGWHVVVVDDLRSSPVDLSTLLDEWCPGGSIEVVTEAVEDFGFLRCGIRPDIIYHLAGPVGATGVLPQAGTIAGSLVQLGRTVGAWAAISDCPLVYVATSESFGTGGECHESSPRTFPPGHSARREYAVGKLAGEQLLLNTEGLDVRIVRPFNVAGPRQSGYGGFVVPRFIAQAMAGKALTIYEPGTQRRAFTHVMDEVDGILRVGMLGKAGGEYNLGRVANLTTIEELAGLVIEAVGSGYMTVVDPRRLHGPTYTEAVDKWPRFSESAADLGWNPMASLGDIVADAYSYMRRPGMAERLGCL
jgi:UDP-glucose 4-epimerase